MRELGAGHERVVVSGCVGPSDDGYRPSALLSADEAEAYHAVQVASLADADRITAITMTYAEEAIGVSRAAARVGLPCVISFTVETDGRLPSGQSLADAIAQVDAAAAARVLHDQLRAPDPLRVRVRRARGWSGCAACGRTRRCSSHAELDEATELDAGDPADLGARYAAPAVARWTSSAAAAAPTTATWRRSPAALSSG